MGIPKVAKAAMTRMAIHASSMTVMAPMVSLLASFSKIEYESRGYVLCMAQKRARFSPSGKSPSKKGNRMLDW